MARAAALAAALGAAAARAAGADPCAQYNGTAATDLQLRSLYSAGEYDGNWHNWAGNVQSCSPLLYPKDDAELSGYLQYAAKHGYKVRVTGAHHSALGLVGEDGEASAGVIVISLGRYALSDSTWCTSGDFCVDAAAQTVRANAGQSWLDLYAQIRPDGWFIPTQTAGPFFTIAGSVLSTVHGGVYGASFVHKYVTKMRVMLADGSVQVLEGADVYAWRSSYGLLGVLTAVEMSVIRREPGLDMYTTTSDYVEWTEENYWRFVAEDAEADMDLSFYPGAAGFNMTRKGKYGEFFLDFVSDKDERAYFRTVGVLWKQNTDGAKHTKEELQANYQKKLDKTGAAFREEGDKKAPRIDYTNTAAMAADLVKSTFLATGGLVDDRKVTVNDGYWVGQSPSVTIAAFFVPVEESFAAFDYQRAQARARAYGADSSKCYRQNQPSEYRFVQVTNDSLLQAVPPGDYMVTEMVGFTDVAPGSNSWQRAYAEVECEWTTKHKAVPHMGKLHSFAVNPQARDGLVRPGQLCSACRWITDAQKDAFDVVRRRFDPNGLFAAGFAHDMLLKKCPADCPAPAPCSAKGTPDCGPTPDRA